MIHVSCIGSLICDSNIPQTNNELTRQSSRSQVNAHCNRGADSAQHKMVVRVHIWHAIHTWFALHQLSLLKSGIGASVSMSIFFLWPSRNSLEKDGISHTVAMLQRCVTMNFLKRGSSRYCPLVHEQQSRQNFDNGSSLPTRV